MRPCNYYKLGWRKRDLKIRGERFKVMFCVSHMHSNPVDAVLSLLEPFSRLGNGLIHKDRGSSCTDSSCTPGDVLPPATQSPLIEK